MQNSLYQHGTLAMLVPGLFAGTQSVGELLTHGDTGIGTLTGLDGELIIVDGVVYQVSASGNVRTVAENEQIPFANVHFQGAPTTTTTVAALDYAAMQAAALAQLGTRNVFAAFQLHGTFAKVTTRAVPAQIAPYPTLIATAAAQEVFTATAVEGTLSGYYSPQLYAGAVAPGFHLHFLNDQHDFGGHVLDASVASGTLQLTEMTDFQLHLPTTNAAFRNANLEGPDVTGAIAQAEN